MYLIIYVAELQEYLNGLAVVGDGLVLALLRLQRHTHFIAGDAQRLAVARLAEQGNGLCQHFLGLAKLLQADEYGGFLRQSHHTLGLVARLLVELVGPVNIL